MKILIALNQDEFNKLTQCCEYNRKIYIKHIADD